jgi:hypothetical protein
MEEKVLDYLKKNIWLLGTPTPCSTMFLEKIRVIVSQRVNKFPTPMETEGALTSRLRSCWM